MRVLTFQDLRDRKGIPFTRQHINRLEDAGQFPQRVKLGGNTVVWIESEVDQWLADQAANRAVDTSPAGGDNSAETST